MTKIKICGITEPREIEYANELMPDFIGFVFAPSKRQVSQEAAAFLKSGLCKEIKSVGVFVNQDIQTIAALCSQKVIDIVQLHGDEDAVYLYALQQAVKNPIIRAVRVQSEADIQNVLFTKADYILFDTYKKGSAGGTGEAFNWHLAAAFPRSFFLAGGLCQENLKEAIRTCNPFCADISSGAETNGKKDRQKMQSLIEIVRSVN
jgi:phosphoribosylanthranilate isomerase